MAAENKNNDVKYKEKDTEEGLYEIVIVQGELALEGSILEGLLS